MSNKISITQKQIENSIFNIRGVQVMIDFHLAMLYEVETKRLNEQVKRNLNRFPEPFMFQLTATEWKDLQSQIATGLDWSQFATGSQKHRSTKPYAFTEQGVAMLSAVLNSDTAIKVSIEIMNAFVKMRHLLLENSLINNRLEKMELKQLETDQKFEKVFKALESKNVIPTQGVFFDGQVFDAYELASKIIRSAKKSIVLVDNYINESTLTHLAKKAKPVKVYLLTKALGKQLSLDIQKANEQYGGFDAKLFTQSHDRFLIIDGKEVYHLGASLKDLGKKWFAFSKLEAKSVNGILNAILELI
ncbi:MAG: ORF6N domain-containing protein [Saprospiraceae bacterium]|nr:ORF6N domain-containing protein [Saprospiraceae bacterium]